ncbi:pseudouridine synthase [Ancylomarina longa]|uniref:Pseudouridine synthase n=1 Tax=Ancylomarina longa TaxID=2487017 RepID=A0A434AG96_9BACT|nr:pseudouridine synthase [Ancylomarina longa]RUT73403.1 rRNA pseudouridine synthase [Ancylomarina longa]
MEENNNGKPRRVRPSFPSKKYGDSKPKEFHSKYDKDSKPSSNDKEEGIGHPKQYRKNSENQNRRNKPRYSPNKRLDSKDDNGDFRQKQNRSTDSDREYRKNSGKRQEAREDRSKFTDRSEKKSDYSKITSEDSSHKKLEKNFGEKENLRNKHYSKKKQLLHAKMMGPKDGILRLNKYISNSGECSRREADKRIEDGRVTVNGQIVTEVGTKVKLDDEVQMDGKLLMPEAKVYLVLNKPKDFVTTLDDPLGRKKVTDLIKNACTERVYPVGRLDRMTTGVLIFTNDGDLTKRLTHPSYNKKKIYHVFLDRPIAQEELDRIAKGLDLEDGLIQSDAISYTDANDKTQVGIEIHSGKNRIVRRIFEHLGYNIEKLDRVFFAGITKKNIPRGKWRFLTEEEVRMLKIF